MLPLVFDNRFVRELPGDPEPRNFRRQVSGACYSLVSPTPVAEPRLFGYSAEMIERLGIRFDSSVNPTSDPRLDRDFVETFAGNRLAPGMQPYAMCYGGHQFGSWAGQLGDGRAINLGEVVNEQGERWVLQLKGAGPTPYSRTADGLAVLRSSVREFLCSEAMHHLGVPTTRALTLIATGESVMRDMFYDGNARFEPGAVVCRVAPSFTRFGNFQIFTARRDLDNLKCLVDYTITTDFSHLGPPDDQVRAAWFQEVCTRTAEMILHWMRVGFVHGVMNTDNMSIVGQTIDYGPYGWLEDYDPGWTPNTTDSEGKRYSYGQQPQIAFWNLLQLANAILPVLPDKTPLEQGLDQYSTAISEGWTQTLGEKMGFAQWREQDSDLTDQMFELLIAHETDMTIFYRRLAMISTAMTGDDADLSSILEPAYYQPEQIDQAFRERTRRWLVVYRDRLRSEGRPDTVRREAMDRVNPKYVLRNYLAQIAIDQAEQGDPSEIGRLLDVLRDPYDEQPGNEKYAEKRPEWARHRAGCSMLSCSS